MIEQILRQMLWDSPRSISQMQNDEDGDLYSVWRLDYPDKSYILKQAKGNECAIYQQYFMHPAVYAPEIHGITHFENKDYLLMEYISGHDLKKCNREDLIRVLDSLIHMQKDFWQAPDPLDSFAHSLNRRNNRRAFLPELRLVRAYDAYLEAYQSMPRCLCHDDLLPFNVILSQDRAVLIDWEVGGILPYPTSLARLIAHGEEKEDAFFYMKESDRAYAMDYYYQHFVEQLGISRADFNRSMALCLFYEYCEWVYVGNKYGDTQNARYRHYLKKAMSFAADLGF